MNFDFDSVYYLFEAMDYIVPVKACTVPQTHLCVDRHFQIQTFPLSFSETLLQLSRLVFLY